MVALSSCRGLSTTAADTPDARESPQASAQPAVLATAPTSSAQPAPISEGGPAPAPLRSDEPLAGDALTREVAGYTLSAALRPSDVLGPPRAPEVSASGLEAARKATELKMAIDLSPSRMRIALAGRGFVLPPDTEIRARADRYGHVMIWPGARSYRPLAPGAMRALFGERRFDVAPITNAEVVTREEVGRRISIRTRRADVTTRAARASFEIGKLEGAGEGGVLLCRLLLDLMSAPPHTPLCAVDELPVRVDLQWTSQGSLVFELTGVLKRADIAGVTLLVPPPSANFASAPMPTLGVASMLSPQELGALRTSDVDVTVPAPGAAATNAGEPVLSVINPSVELRLLYLDGVPVLWAAPSARGELRGLRRGRYVAQWRTFLGDSVDAAVTQAVPGVTQAGAPVDAGAR